MYSLFKLLDFIINVYVLLIIVRAVLSWIPHNPNSALIKLIEQVTEPPLAWIRQWLPNLGGLDVSPVILIFALMVVKRIVFSILFKLL